jgi:hypothetical protein
MTGGGQMKGKAMIKGFLLAAAFVIGGCASYSPSLVKLDTAGPGVSKKAQGDLTVYVDEYTTEEKCKRAFDTNLADQGVLTVLLLLENNGAQPYDVKVADISMCDDSACLKPLAPEQAAGKAKRSSVGRAIGWSMIVPIISIPIAAAASASHTRNVNKQIVQDFCAKGFTDGVVMPNKEHSGFLFFPLDKGRKDLLGLRLEMSARNTDTGEIATIAVPLPDAEIKGRKTDPEKGKDKEEKRDER